MANFYSVNATKGLPTTSGSQHSRMVDGTESNGTVKWLHDTYVATTVSGESQIFFGKRPDSCWVIGGTITFDTCSGTQVYVGMDTPTNTRCFPSATLTSNGTVTFIPHYVSTAGSVMVTVVSGTQPYSGNVLLSMLFVE